MIAEHLKRRGTGPPPRDQARSKLKNTPETGKRATHGKQKRKKEQRCSTPEFTDSERESGDTPAADGPSAVDATPGLCPLTLVWHYSSLVATLEPQMEYPAEDGPNALRKMSEYRTGNLPPQSLASKVLDQIQRNNELSTHMLFELPLADDIKWSPQLASLTLACVSDVSISAPELLTELHIYDICSRATQAQIC
ncbi:hypothetical protein B0H14DRAFT_3451889 [Mycena olivaceomarginata]|nr:hypothetical protein B0H14DRAFT_3451889 [Mycena olivaceomarginata]